MDMPDTAAPLRFELAPARSRAARRGCARSSAAVALLAALFVPLFVAGIEEPERAQGPAELVLVSPGAPPEAPAETDTNSAHLGPLFPEGLPSDSVAVAEPVWTPLALGIVDALSGDACRSSLAPPPRRT